MKIVNLLSSILFLIGLFSCATSKVVIPQDVHHEFITVANIITENCKKGSYTQFNNIEIELVDKFESPFIVGQCWAYPGSSYRKIQLLKSFWNNFDDLDRMTLMAHEMIHCFLNQPYHVNKFRGHIMNSSLPNFSGMSVLLNHVNQYVKESCNKNG